MRAPLRLSLVVVAAACTSARPVAPTPAPVAPSTSTTSSATTTTTTTATTTRDTVDLTRRPPLGPPPTLTVPPAAERTLANGMRLVVVEQHELPLADAVLVVGAGGETDPVGKDGLATLTASLLEEGTATRTSLQIADQASYLGITVDAGAGWDASRATLHTPTAQLDSALALFADVVTHPSFPQREFDRVKRERLTALLQLRDRAPAIADRAFAQLVFGPTHPYGRPLAGTEGATRAITRADVERFWRTHWRPNAATLVVVGDVTADDVARRVERAFGAWERAAVPEPVAPAAPAARATTVYLVDKPGAPQSSIRIGLPGVARTSPDYFPLLVMNTILGGSFTSRLNQNLRETHGYSYGAGSRFDMRRAAGPFVARAEVTGTATDSALVEFMKELRAIADTVPTTELEKAKQYLQLQMPGEFETTGDIASQLVPLVLYGLPLDYYATYGARIGAVTQADVQRVARQYVDAGKFVVVVVGDRKSVEPTLRKLQVAPVTMRSISEVLGGR